jgi:hypothetical protein
VLSTGILAVLLYFFVIDGSQEMNAAALKRIYDVEKLNRIVSRIDTVVPELGETPLPIVVIGGLDYGGEQRQRLKSYGLKPYYWQDVTETFAPYRRVELLNFFFGHNYVTWPTKAQVDAAVTSVQGRRPWPAPEAVYLQNGVLVMLLQRYEPHRVWRRPFRLSHAANAGSSSMAW